MAASRDGRCDQHGMEVTRVAERRVGDEENGLFLLCFGALAERKAAPEKSEGSERGS